LRRSTPVFLATIVGASLSASSIVAQQSSVPAGSVRGGTTRPADGTVANQAANSTLYGMTTTRSARYLLRNGLDYLNYQQYERALKFLRDAETHKRELNDAEKLALKQGIESAQRGLREAADAEAPYALSERTARPRGFVPAKAEERVASSGGVKARQTRPSRVSESDDLGGESDDRAQPVRLTSADVPNGGSLAPTSANSPAELPPASYQQPPANVQSVPAEPASMPVIPKLQPVLPLTDPTESNDGAMMQRPRTAALAPSLAAESPTLPKAPASQALGQPAKLNMAPAVPTGPSETPAMAGQALDIAPAPIQNNAGLKLEPVPTSTPNAVPLSGPDTTAPIHQEAADPVTLTAPSIPPVQATVPRVPMSERTLPAQTPIVGTVSPVPAGASGLPHRETEDLPRLTTAKPAVDPAAAQTTGTEQNATPALAAVAPLSASSPDTDNKLPALPPELERSTPASAPVDPNAPVPTAVTPTTTVATATSSAAGVVSQPSATRIDELPPLPGDLGERSAAAAKANAESTVPTPITPTTQPVAADPESANLPQLPEHVEQAPSLGAQTAVEARVQAATPGVAGNPVASGRESDLPSASELPALPGAEPAVVNSPVNELSSRTNANAQHTSPDIPDNGDGALPTTPTIATSTATATQPSAGTDLMLPERAPVPSSLRPEQQREVDEIARRQEDELRQRMQNPPQPTPLPREATSTSDLRTQTQLDISRAPSPAEARPIKAIPVPEDWVPLPPRNWDPQRKYWAAAATCHLPLYFQDPVLERYGHSVEQLVGPVGRYLSYPVDDPTQSTQRNQLVQPFFSWGLFCFQIIAWPYNIVVDPPWEAQYDLGYYRPGDNIPTDLYWLPLHGYGPPLHGSNY
jgi:hypothetical protein